MSGTQWVGIKLEPGKPNELRVPDGELLQFQQVALAAPPKKGTVAVVSIKTAKFPELVICTLRAGCEQCQMELIVSPDDFATLSVKGAAVDVCGHFMPDDNEDIDSTSIRGDGRDEALRCRGDDDEEEDDDLDDDDESEDGEEEDDIEELDDGEDESEDGEEETTTMRRMRMRMTTTTTMRRKRRFVANLQRLRVRNALPLLQSPPAKKSKAPVPEPDEDDDDDDDEEDDDDDDDDDDDEDDEDDEGMTTGRTTTMTAAKTVKRAVFSAVWVPRPWLIWTTTRTTTVAMTTTTTRAMMSPVGQRQGR